MRFSSIFLLGKVINGVIVPRGKCPGGNVIS